MDVLLVVIVISVILILAVLGVERVLHRLFPKAPEPKLIYTNLQGVGGQTPEGEARQAIIAGLHRNDLLHLVPDPDPSADPYAVQVLTSQGKQIGYLPSDSARRVWETLKKERPVEAVVRSIGPTTANHPQAEVSLKLILPPAGTPESE